MYVREGSCVANWMPVGTLGANPLLLKLPRHVTLVGIYALGTRKIIADYFYFTRENKMREIINKMKYAILTTTETDTPPLLNRVFILI